jgi:hypothetical protein
LQLVGIALFDRELNVVINGFDQIVYCAAQRVSNNKAATRSNRASAVFTAHLKK